MGTRARIWLTMILLGSHSGRSECRCNHEDYHNSTVLGGKRNLRLHIFKFNRKGLGRPRHTTRIYDVIVPELRNQHTIGIYKDTTDTVAIASVLVFAFLESPDHCPFRAALEWYCRRLAVLQSTCSFAAGLLVAASFSESNLIKYGGYVLVASPLSCAFAFAWILTIKTNVMIDLVDAEKVQGSSVDCGLVLRTPGKTKLARLGTDAN
ncbi:hypothetical protein BDM02DRAFT_3119659 [Thelephora ganbajun]|uniref:Uncharacterized protein n=1 Tax=Thelephora ganbajun TaxID=370292 RepID=A0ACB6Z8F4_THEGA|nr:hypothetical protein BDM02DRAFT_3119659 [Thelephora ganbajun]